jgi:hypothetical protein
MLAEAGRRPPPRAGALRKAGDDVVHRHGAQFGVFHVDDDAALAEMRIGDRVRDG